MEEIKKLELIETKKLVPYARNARTHSEEQIKMIMASIREFGFLSPIIIDKDFNVLAGHGRLIAAERLGLDKVPCIQENYLTEIQKKAYTLADNRISELAGWDEQLLRLEFEELKEADFDLNLSGFNDEFLDNFLNEKPLKNTNQEYASSEFVEDKHTIKCPQCGYEFEESLENEI